MEEEEEEEFLYEVSRVTCGWEGIWKPEGLDECLCELKTNKQRGENFRN